MANVADVSGVGWQLWGLRKGSKRHPPQTRPPPGRLSSPGLLPDTRHIGWRRRKWCSGMVFGRRTVSGECRVDPTHLGGALFMQAALEQTVSISGKSFAYQRPWDGRRLDLPGNCP